MYKIKSSAHWSFFLCLQGLDNLNVNVFIGLETTGEIFVLMNTHTDTS